MAYDPDLKAHRDWLGYLQPVGVVVSPPALIAAQAILNRNVAPEQQRFLALVEPVRVNGSTLAALPDFPVQTVATGTDLDTVEPRTGRHWQASAQARFERLLRETGVPTGLLCNGTHLRLVHAARGETSGHVTFPVAAMTEVAGRPILAALQLLLSAERLFVLPEKQRLPALLFESRRYQAEVSTRLAEQVLQALYELLRGL